jgi:hypothetical protein
MSLRFVISKLKVSHCEKKALLLILTLALGIWKYVPTVLAEWNNVYAYVP